MGWLPAEKKEKRGSQPASESLPFHGPEREHRLYEIKGRLHRDLVERLDVSQFETMEEGMVAAEIRKAISQLLAEDPFPLNSEERTRLAQELEFEILGLGPLEPLVRDNSI